MPKVTVLPEGRTIYAQDGGGLLELLLDAGVGLENACNGRGRCGKCRVTVRGDGLEAPGKEETALLTEEERASGVRLACMVKVRGDLTVECMAERKACRILTDGTLPSFPLDCEPEGYGLAVDIGTTTVVAELVERRSGKRLAVASALNWQIRYGLDVLTRITYEKETPGGASVLQAAIIKTLNDLIRELCKRARISCEEIVEIDVAANCTMTHMLLGVDATPIGCAPYEPQFTEARELLAKQIGLQAGERTKLYCLPQVSSYVGADIVAGAYVSGLGAKEGNVLFLDIGTNGEMVLAHGGELLCCSCAAGPALEGMNIRCGMRAEEGAVEKVCIVGGEARLTVIGGEKAVGLCGSGILSATQELLRVGLIKPSGALVKKTDLAADDVRHRILTSDKECVLQSEPRIFVTQSDIRQVQLAKGAILSGITALLQRAGVTPSELTEVIVAGQFGAHLEAGALLRVGFLPEIPKEKIRYVGNAAKSGAYVTLLSRKAKREVEALARRMIYLDLTKTERYDRLLADCMRFSWPATGNKA